MKISVLRLGHRKKRDIRVTTHCLLVGRAFFANELILSGEEDPTVLQTIKSVSKNWGGELRIKYEKNWGKLLKNRRNRGHLLVHLSMFGLPILEKIDEIRKAAEKKPLLVIIGAEKVPPEVYKLADYNIALTNQPHSEVAALALFLSILQFQKPLESNAQKHFKNARYVITPGAKGRK